MARAWAIMALTALVFGAPVAASAQPAAPEPAKKQPTAKKQSAAKKPNTDADNAAPKAARDPADVEKALEAAKKSLEAGKADLAVNQVNGLVSGGGIESRSMARALALRGQAYRKQGKPAQALADLQSALWLKGGLPDDERTAAQQAYSGAHREAGLGDNPTIPGAKSAAAAKAATGTGRTAAAPTAVAATSASAVQTASTTKPPQAARTAADQVAAAPAAPPAPAPAVQAQQGGNFFSNLFGGGTAAPAQAPAAPRTATPTAGTRVAAVAPAVAPAIPAATAPAPDKAAPASGKYRLQLGPVRSREEAKAVGDKVKAEHASLVGGRQYDIEEIAFGNMGTFYRVRIGPYTDANAPKAACAAIRAKGIDCMLAGP